MCARSVDGGLSWGPGVPVYPKPEPTESCGAQHGHLAAAPDGTVYLPTSLCGTHPTVYISDDDGDTWRKSTIADMDIPFIDPSVSVDSAGNLYAAFIDERGRLFYATSRDNGGSWSRPVHVAREHTADLPVIVADAPGRVVIAYPATDDLPQGYETEGYRDGGDRALSEKVAWGANMTVSYNGLSGKPRFSTVVTTGSDPIGRGAMCVGDTPCDYLYDFMEAVIGPDGRPYASFVDGCLDACAKESLQESGWGEGLLVSLRLNRPLCRVRCWRYVPADAALDPSAAWNFALSPGRLESSRMHAVDPPRLRSLMRAASERRAISSNRGMP
jgi:hypothetical protein